MITATAANTGAKPKLLPAVINIFARITGTAPLKASNKRVIKNHFLPNTRFTFVAPVEPEPIVLRSSPVFDLTIRYCIENKIYNLYKVNELLLQQGQIEL